MRLQGETRELSVTLTPEELEIAAVELAEEVQLLSREEADFESWREYNKIESKRRKGEIEEVRTRMAALAGVVETGKEKRDVSCGWQYALEAGYAFLVRSDTQELVTHRKLRDEERQMEIGEPPFAEPTPEQLEEWLKALPVNEAETLPEGHAGEVTAEDHDPLLDPGGFADEDQDEDGNTLGGDEDWEDEGDDQGENDDDDDYDEGGEDTPIDDAIVTDEHDEPLEEPVP